MSTFVSALVSILLEFFWKKFLEWRRLKEQVEEGRQGVRDAVTKETKKAQDEIAKVARPTDSAVRDSLSDGSF